MSEIAIQVENISKTFKTTPAVKTLSFKVETATCFGLLGPNGAGKTTMMNMIYGKNSRDLTTSDRLEVFGYDPKKNALEIKYLAGIVPQENNLDVELSVIENLMIYAKFYGIKKHIALPQIDKLLVFMELTQKKNSRIRELSGGMQRRLIIARALINNPRLLILDEPTTGLDPQVRQLIWDKIYSLKRTGVTILLTTHYMEEAFQLCDNLMIMDQGKSVMKGHPGELISNHIETYVLEIIRPAQFDSKSKIKDVRAEKTHSRYLLYSNQLDSLNNISKHYQTGEFFLRQSNLEDLFLKITGRKLNES